MSVVVKLEVKTGSQDSRAEKRALKIQNSCHPAVRTVNYTNIVKFSNDFCAQDAFRPLSDADPFRKTHARNPED